MAAKKQKPYAATLTLGDKTYKGDGPTAFDALASLPKPQKIVGKGVFTLSHGDKKVQQTFWPVRLKRLFWNKTYQAVQAKMLAAVMK